MIATTSINRIAFIGIGRMGEPMAANLVKAGFDVVVFDARADAAREFASKRGGAAAASVVEAARGADVLVTMLPDDSAVRGVLLGLDGATLALAAGAIAIDMGSSSPQSTREIGDALQQRGIVYVDAPVMGGVLFAKDASLDIMVGSNGDAIERCMPLFNVLGRRVFRCGALGSGHALKALANYVNATALIGMIEAMTIGRKFGLDADLLAEALASMCTGRQHPLEKKIVPHVLTRQFATGMTLGLIAKDVAIAASFAGAIGAAAPLAEHVRDIWAEAAKLIGASVDQTEIVKLWEQRSGVTL